MSTKLVQQSSSATTVAPRLLRAVAEATQPYGPFLQGPALHTLEEYLADTSKAQAVYQALLNRASAEPISLAVVAKCVDVLKRYLSRYAVSREVLQQIDNFCQTTARNLGNSHSGLQKSVLYLQTLAVNLLDREAGNAANRLIHARGISEPALLVKRGSSSSLGRDEFHRTNSVPDGTEPAVTPSANGSQTDHHIAEGSMAPSALGIPEDEDGLEASEGMKCDVLRWRWAPSTADEAATSFEAGISASYRELSQFQLSAWQEPEGAARPSISHAHAVQNEIQIIRRVQRQQVQQASHPGPESARPKLRDNRPRLLFQHRPYSEQERLDLSDAEIAAIVEAVLGVVDGPGLWGDKDILDVQQNGGRGSKQNEQPGRVCANILIKLLLDLWTLNDAAFSFPLALMLLYGALENKRPAVRARAFDVIYNLSVHAELLYPSQTNAIEIDTQGRDRKPAGATEKEPATGGGDNLSETLNAQGIPVAPDAAFETNKQRFTQWLRLLLYQLLLMITQMQESKEEVWSAALGALLHLTVEAGKPDRAAMQSLPPRVLAALLRCCIRFHWSEQTHCHLIRMTANLLYAPVAGSNGDKHADKTLDAEAVLVLKEERLQDFGGIEEVITHFKHAPSREVARNLLSVLLDYVSAKHIQAGVESGENTSETGLLEDLRLIGYMLEAGNMAELLQGAFQCAWPGFSTEFAKALLSSPPFQDGTASGNGHRRGSLAALTHSILGRLESLACDCAVSFPPQELLPAVQHTLDCVQGGSEEPGTASLPDFGQLDSVWTCLADHFCGENSWAARFGASWLLSLLVAAAEQHLASGVHKSASFRSGAVALFPQLPGYLPSPKGPRGIQGQPHLAALLRRILAQAPSEQRVSSRFVEVVRRLLQYVKFKCGSQASGRPPPSQPSADRTRSLNIMSPADSLEKGLNSPPAVREGFLSDEDITPPPLGNNAAEESPSKAGDFEWEDSAEIWAHLKPVDLMLPIVFLTVEWLLDSPAESRGDACLEAAIVLLEIVTSRSDGEHIPRSATKATAGSSGTPADWVAEEYAQTAHPQEAAPDGLLSATQTCSTVVAYLLGAVAVPKEVLLKVSPVLLARLFHHLGNGALPTKPYAQGVQAAAWARDVRAALLLLLIARCSLDTAALQQAGGEGVFVDLLSDNDPRVRFHASTFLQQRLRTARPEVYRRALRQLMQQAQQCNDDRILRNAHLQLSAMLEMRLVDFSV